MITIFLLGCIINAVYCSPNVVFIMADDLGWGDVSWHDSGMYTPNLDSLAHNNAALLNKAYVNHACTPTRTAFLTGYYPFHVGTQNGVFHAAEDAGIPVSYKFFPKRLQELGYSTYMVGKWHLGYCNEAYTPNERGFDKFYGFYMGAQDYYDHNSKETALNGTKITGNDAWSDQIYDGSKVGRYNTEVFGEKAREWLDDHKVNKPNTPFYLYTAFSAPHSPYEAPRSYYRACKHHTSRARKIYCAMVNALDYQVGLLVQNLKDNGFYDDTVIIFSTDNGGAASSQTYSSNWPLRGSKGSFWDGANRAISFVHSPKYISNPGERQSLFSIVDWYATILTAVGDTTATFAHNQNIPPGYILSGDGINQWDMIRTGATDENRHELVINIIGNDAAIIKDNYKLIVGKPSPKANDWYSVYGGTVLTTESFNRNSKRLYDLDSDEYEVNDLSATYPDVLAELEAKLNAYKLEEVAELGGPVDPRGYPENFGGAWGGGWCTAQ